MKKTVTLILGFAALCASGQPTTGTLPADKASPYFVAGQGSSLSFESYATRPTKITLAIGDGLTVDCKTGDVKLPANFTLKQSAIAFWRALAEAYPSVAAAMSGQTWQTIPTRSDGAEFQISSQPEIGAIYFTNCLQIQYSGSEVFKLEGLPRKKVGDGPWPDAYLHPKQASDVKAVLTTEDGRRWRAVWTEEKQ